MLCTLCGCWSLWWHFSSFLRKSRITHVHGWHERLLFLCSSPAQVNVITEISYCFIFTEQWEHTFGCLHWELPHKILILMQFLMVPWVGRSSKTCHTLTAEWSLAGWGATLNLWSFMQEQPVFLWALHWHLILLVWETAGITSGEFEITLLCFDPASYPNSKTSIAVQ